MGDPYGLVSDESDFLIHPAKIATGEGVRFYSDYRFTYRGVKDWDYNLDHFNTAGTLTGYNHYDTSGSEYSHETLLGASLPSGSGRMGFFLSYDRMKGDYDGNEDLLGMDNYATYDITKDLDNFALRLLYGLPLGGFNLGGEVRLSYRSEENTSWLERTNGSSGYLNYIVNTSFPDANLLPFLPPYDSNYWEALLKGSLEGHIGPADVEFTLRGGFVFNGDNSLTIERQIPVGIVKAVADMDGDVEGWQIGGDLWLRYPLDGGLSLPFLVSVGYQDKTRDGEGPGRLGWTPWSNQSYETGAKDLQIVVGGGADNKLGAGTSIAAGIYYKYFQGEKDIIFHVEPASYEYFDSYDVPLHTEHQVLVRFAGEREFTPTVALRMGLDFFYGWVKEDFEFTYSFSAAPVYTDNLSLNGYRWGVEGSVGGTFTFDGFTLEPFLNAGYQDLNLDGDGKRTGTSTGLWKIDKSRRDWFIGAGFSVLFDL